MNPRCKTQVYTRIISPPLILYLLLLLLFFFFFSLLGNTSKSQRKEKEKENSKFPTPPQSTYINPSASHFFRKDRFKTYLFSLIFSPLLSQTHQRLSPSLILQNSHIFLNFLTNQTTPRNHFLHSKSNLNLHIQFSSA